MRTRAVGSQLLRVAVRPGDGTRPPLVLASGIGASLEALQPFVDHRDPVIEVIRFDVPGVGGSPLPRLPYRLPRLARLVARLLDHLRPQSGDLLGVSLGGRLAPAVPLAAAPPLPAAGPGRHRHRHADGAGPPTGAGTHGHPPPPP